MTNLDSVLKSRDITVPTKVRIVKAMAFPVVMHGCESWTVKKAEHQRMIPSNCGAEDDSESPLNNKEIKPVNLKGNQPWIFTGRADAEAEGPVFWSSDADKQLIGKVPDAGKDWGQKEKRASQDVMAGRHHQLSGYELSKLQEMVKDREAR